MNTRKKLTNTTQRRKPLRSGRMVVLRASSAEYLLRSWTKRANNEERYDSYGDERARVLEDCISDLRRLLGRANKRQPQHVRHEPRGGQGSD